MQKIRLMEKGLRIEKPWPLQLTESISIIFLWNFVRDDRA